MTSTSAYIPAHDEDAPWGFDWTPEFSRRARGVPVYAALRSLGRRASDRVRRPLLRPRACAWPAASPPRPAVEVLNDVVLNQVLVRFDDDDDVTNAVIAADPARRHLLARRQHLPRTHRDADLGRRLADDRRGRRPSVDAIVRATRG